MSIHANMMDSYVGGIEPNSDFSSSCPDCGGIKSKRAKQCRQCACQRIGRERIARAKVPGQIARLLVIYRARQAAQAAVDAVIDSAVGGFEREVGKAVEEVKR